MRFNRIDYADDLGRLRAERRASQRAIGDNFHFEENVGPERVADFEKFDGLVPGLLPVAADYFYTSVQGVRRDHIPSTFQAFNAAALMSAGIEPAQKIVRVERLDDTFNGTGSTDPAQAHDAFEQLSRAIASSDRSVVDPIIRKMNGYGGARPSFACFRAEVAADLGTSDWLPRLRERLGLGHFALADGQTAYFALMQYSVAEVIKQASVDRPFAVPTVLESRNSEFFFPGPPGQGVGYAVDLQAVPTRDWIREFLHIRLTYQAGHLARVGRLAGPTPVIDLAGSRDAHLARVRTQCGRPDYGAPMTGEVD